MYCTVAELIDWHSAERIIRLAPAKAPHNAYLVTAELLHLVISNSDISGFPPEDVAATFSTVEKIEAAIVTASNEADGYLLRRYGELMRDLNFTDRLAKESILGERVGNLAVERLSIGSNGETEQVTRIATEARRWLREIADAKVELGIQSDPKVRATQDYSHAVVTKSRLNWDLYDV